MEFKTCGNCKEEKSLDEFAKRKASRDGMASSCKECNKEYRKEYYKNKKEYIIERCKEYRKANPEKRRQYEKKYRLNNREKVAHKNAIYRRKNAKKINEIIKSWVRKNPGKMRAYRRKEVELLKDRYLKTKLKQRGLSIDQINNYPELMEVQRLIIKTARLCKTSQNSAQA